MTDARVIKIADVPVFQRGDGIETTLLVGKESCGAENITSGLTKFPAGREVPIHSHNCAEQVTLIEGAAEVEIEGARTKIVPYDTTYIPAGVRHRFINTGPDPMTILWIYDTDEVTRTFAESGETVAHLSAGDVIAKG